MGFQLILPMSIHCINSAESGAFILAHCPIHIQVSWAEERGETMGICFHNADKCNVVTGTNFDEEGPFNQGELNRLYHSTKHQHLPIKELDTKLCYCHPFGEDLWCLLGAFGEQCTQMTGEQLVSRQCAQVPCQTKSQAAEQITFSNRQLRHTSISFEKPIHFQNARVKMTSGHWPPYSCV